MVVGHQNDNQWHTPVCILAGLFQRAASGSARVPGGKPAVVVKAVSEPSGGQRYVERAGFQGSYAQSAASVGYGYRQGMYLSLAISSPCIRTLRCGQRLR